MLLIQKLNDCMENLTGSQIYYLLEEKDKGFVEIISCPTIDN